MINNRSELLIVDEDHNSLTNKLKVVGCHSNQDIILLQAIYVQQLVGTYLVKAKDTIPWYQNE